MAPQGAQAQAGVAQQGFSTSAPSDEGSMLFRDMILKVIVEQDNFLPD